MLAGQRNQMGKGKAASFCPPRYLSEGSNLHSLPRREREGGPILPHSFSLQFCLISLSYRYLLLGTQGGDNFLQPFTRSVLTSLQKC